MNPVKKLTYLEALIIAHNNMLLELANNKLNVHMLNEQSIINSVVNPQLEQNILHYKDLVVKIIISIGALNEMIKQEELQEEKSRVNSKIN